MSHEPEHFRDALLMVIPSLRAYARALCREPSVADDLVQDTILIAWEKRQSVRDLGALKGWLFAVLRNHYLQAVRKSRGQMPNVDLEDAENASLAPTQLNEIESRQVLHILQSLPPEQLEAIMLVAVEGLSCEEAAAALDCRPGTIKSRVSRGRTALMKLIEPEASQAPSASEAAGHRETTRSARRFAPLASQAKARPRPAI